MPRLIYIPKPQSQIFTVNYGRLYNWYAATDARNIANTGWHVPSPTEIYTLSTYLGGDSVSGGKLKEAGFTYWNSPNTLATNESEFNARGSGNRNNSTGGFSQLKTNLYLRTSSAFGQISMLTNTSGSFFTAVFQGGNNDGYSMRLLKDSTTLSHGQTGTYTGNDGKIYRTICIGTQEWLADNLSESKYRDGSLIPEVTDNTAWTALTTGGMCSYNNNDSNI